jgi:hypothetical protein
MSEVSDRKHINGIKNELDTAVYHIILESTEYGGREVTSEEMIVALRELADDMQHSLDHPLPPETGGDPWDRIE